MAISRKTKVFLAGHNGFLGSAIYDCLKKSGFNNIITFEKKDLNLFHVEDVLKKVCEEEPEIIINAAGTTGGVSFNQRYPATLSLENLLIQNSIFYASIKLPSSSRVIFFGSSCMYPRFSGHPMDEGSLFQGLLEPTSFSYSMAKLSGVSVAEAINKEFKKPSVTTIIPSGVYGPRDNFDLNKSHVVPALIKKFSMAKNKNIQEVTLHGDGSPVRQFIFVKDLAEFVIFCIDNKKATEGIFNIGNKEGISINNLAELIKREVKFKGKISWDTSESNGAPYKVLDTTKTSKLGWHPTTPFSDGIRETIKFCSSSILA